MRIHKNGNIILAKAEEATLIRLQEYINTQAEDTLSGIRVVKSFTNENLEKKKNLNS